MVYIPVDWTKSLCTNKVWTMIELNMHSTWFYMRKNNLHRHNSQCHHFLCPLPPVCFARKKHCIWSRSYSVIQLECLKFCPLINLGRIQVFENNFRLYCFPPINSDGALLCSACPSILFCGHSNLNIYLQISSFIY